MSATTDHKLLGEFVHEGITWSCRTKPQLIDKVKTFPLQDGNVVITSYTKSGTTWNQEILDLIMNDGHYDETEFLQKRVPYLESCMPEYDMMDRLTPGRKLLKSHLSYRYYKTQVAEGKAKFIVPMRNLKDNLVSYYNYYRINIHLGKFTGTWDEFFTLFKKKQLFGGDWMEFNLSWWNERHRKNVLIVFYEDLKGNPEAEIGKIATFCGKILSDEIVATIIQKSSFDVMKNNAFTNFSEFDFIDNSTSSLMRKGEVGDWKHYFNTEQLEYIKQLYQPKLDAVGLFFKDELLFISY